MPNITPHILQMQDLNLDNKRVVIRVDLNVPMQDGKIQDDTRIKAILPTLQMALEKNARIILLSHLGQPKLEQHAKSKAINPSDTSESSEASEVFSLKPIAKRLEELMQHPIRFEKNYLGGIAVAPKEIVLCENVRFNPGEMENDKGLAKQLAALGDVFIMDAFATAHRAQASTVGIAEFAPIAGAGLLLTKELTALKKALENPKRPLVAIVAGAKVSSKLPVLKSLIHLVDVLIVGGGIANTFIAAKSQDVGASLYEPELIPAAKQLMEEAAKNNVTLLIPSDVVLAKEFSETAETRIANIDNIQPSEKIADIGPNTLKEYESYIKNSGTILWNGPIGIFELSPFAKGTETLAKAIADSSVFSIAGGGETLAAIDKFHIADKISYISTGGGAFLEYLEGKTLPAVAALEKAAAR